MNSGGDTVQPITTPQLTNGETETETLTFPVTQLVSDSWGSNQRPVIRGEGGGFQTLGRTKSTWLWEPTVGFPVQEVWVEAFALLTSARPGLDLKTSCPKGSQASGCIKSWATFVCPFE